MTTERNDARSRQRDFSRLLEIMALLRSPAGCPWDREQTHESLRQHLLEEAYEVIEAIDEKRFEDLPGELGDLLLQVVFHAQLAVEAGRFDMGDVIEHINDKLVRRHPHVFGDEKIETADEQIVKWEESKMKKEGKKSAIDGVPRQLPALVRAYRMQNKAAAVGFDWPEIGPVWDKLDEEVAELQEALRGGRQEAVEEELGDLFFAMVNISRFLKINPEDALRRAIDKFSLRFRAIEAVFAQQGRSLSDASLDEMDAVWEEVKRREQNK